MNQDAKKTYKPIETEEIFDLIFFRPAARIIVNLVKDIKFITPNLITIIGFSIGLFSLFLVFSDDYATTLAGIGLFTFSGVLDCADGQLARLRNSQSQLGRILDGVADIFLFVALYIIGYATILPIYGNEIDPLWVVVGLSGLSTFVQTSAFDYLKNDYIMISSRTYKSEKDSLEDVLSKFKEIPLTAKTLFSKIGMGLYLFFTWSQALYTSKLCLDINQVAEEKKQDYIKTRKIFLHLSKIVGPGTNIVIFIVCMFFQSFLTFVYIKLIYSNIYIIILFTIQYFVNKRFIKTT